MTRNFRIRAAYLSATLVVILSSNAATAAAAGSSPDVPRRVVRYSDLDITRSSGAAALYTRITAAARAVCEPELGFPEPRMEGALRRCERQAIDRAVIDVNAPLLTSYHETLHSDDDGR